MKAFWLRPRAFMTSQMTVQDRVFFTTMDVFYMTVFINVKLTAEIAAILKIELSRAGSQNRRVSCQNSKADS